MPREAFLDLVRATVENVAALGPARALTGPAARGDSETLERHRAALDPSELAAYDAMVDLARRLVASPDAAFVQSATADRHPIAQTLTQGAR